ncbi:protoporphyrinogen oxidase [Litorilinea aerophila]|uniref:Coproporphyrinogen III oxidase n=1 Tax=Litorilinea aerophila TaxID=1204385 RepID=A0A540VKG4_9CHLR|nr:protoporphyrinogen oxidase [Litorilinea aerophila]MCC9075302.1 protoporphyrinogen oxidase [Litorilinea aerophila]
MTSSPQPYHVVIVGGGITGLAAAYFLLTRSKTMDLPLQCTVLESSSRAGGKVYTELVDGYGPEPFVIEAGPDSFLTQKPWALELALELGLEERLLGTNDERRKTYVLLKGQPVPLPEGVVLIAPTRLQPFLESPLISPLGKLRMALDLILPPKRGNEDESLADFIRRRLGKEALDKIAEPLLAGIYNAEAEEQSLLATFPRLRELEKKHGSLIRGMLAGHRQRSAPNQEATGRPRSAFMSFRNGTQELIDALVKALPPGCLRLKSPVQVMGREHDGRYRVYNPIDPPFIADAVLMTTPSHVTGRLVANLAPDATFQLMYIRYVDTGTISLAYRREDVSHPLDGFGVVIPRSERRSINAITWTSSKFKHRAPEGYVLLRVFFGGSRTPHMMELDDEEILATVRRELGEILGIQAAPVFHRIFRWIEATPQYTVGHLKRVETIESVLPRNLLVAGSPYRGIGLPDCVHQAQLAAEKILANLARQARIGQTSIPAQAPTQARDR